MKAAELIAKHGKLDDVQFVDAIRSLDPHEKDLLVECKVCGAREGAECTETERDKRRAPKKKEDERRARVRLSFKWRQGETVHIGRRITRLLKGIR